MTNIRRPSSPRRSRPRWLVTALGPIVVLCGVIWFLVANFGEGRVRNKTPIPPGVPESWTEPQGRWHGLGWREVSVEEQRSLTEEQRAEIERLRSIGYLSGSQPIPVQSGVTVYDGGRAYPGLNFYTSGDRPGAILMDMQGRVLHSWEHSYIDAWASTPDHPDLRPSAKGSGYWRRAYLFENGDVLAIFEGLALIRVDKSSNLLWAKLGGFHHDLDVMNDGRIYVLTREAHIVPQYNSDEPILEDFVAILDSDGNEISRVSVLEALADSEFAALLERAERAGDIFHTNTVEVLDGRLADELPAFREGNVLLTLREIDLIAVLDMDAGRIVWALSSSWDAPHQATVVGDGEIMVFDNRGNEGASRVLRFDPVTKGVTWLFKGDMPRDFHSQECGSNHYLPNGNTLIVESDRGKAFELAPDGAVVWKYINPAQGGNELQYIATLFELERLPAEFPTDWARRQPSP